MKNILEDFVSEESLEPNSSSYYHVSGMHVCELKGVYVVLSHNEYRDLKEKSKTIQDLDIISYEKLEDAVDEVKKIVEYANSRGAVDARFIQKKRGSDYKVNSQSQEDLQASTNKGKFYITSSYSIECDDEEKNRSPKVQNKYIKKVSSFAKRAFYKVKREVREKLPLTQKISAKLKQAGKIKSKISSMYSGDKKYGIKPESIETSTALLKYTKKGYRNYYVASDLEKCANEKVCSIELVNDSVATNELVATIKNYNLVKLNQHLYVPIKHGIPLGENELENGSHLINNDLIAFDTERAAINYIYKEVGSVEGQEKQSQIRHLDTAIVEGDKNIHYDIYFCNAKYLAVPSIYTIDIEDIAKMEDSELMNRYKFCAYSDDLDFLKLAIKERGDWMDMWPNNGPEISVYQDEYCMIIKELANGFVYDMTKTSAATITKKHKNSISSYIFTGNSGGTKVSQVDKKLITRIGNMAIIEYEDYYFAIKNEFAEDFPNSQYLEDKKTRYDVSLSVIEEYCKDLLRGNE